MEGLNKDKQNVGRESTEEKINGQIIEKSGNTEFQLSFNSHAAFFEGENAFIDALRAMLKGSIDAETSHAFRTKSEGDFSSENIMKYLDHKIKNIEELDLKLEVVEK